MRTIIIFSALLIAVFSAAAFGVDLYRVSVSSQDDAERLTAFRELVKRAAAHEPIMVFSSHVFIFYFLPLALGVYYLLPHRGRNLALTLLSYVFYGWANPLFVVLMFASSSIDYICGMVLAEIGRAHV
jgi:hypothetical protein